MDLDRQIGGRPSLITSRTIVLHDESYDNISLEFAANQTALNQEFLVSPCWSLS
ncbi:hypothetical protein PF010_g33074 [Phytophthora fragariae]|uniref:Uncharacterized protein n=1 Tax=Phytophthora fragariae TaxID=53985 RepID=A0A6G0JDC0_9STRA|nr:hypothetical protein PF003_g37367 [Phytophthora fragariae]KAE8893109.1 hypothetical protein PF003_g22887 [Phytophthora fragariae]KAE9053035.1 hypothetical protein PF010_g33074 [Phytophthora fragariae]